MEKIFDIAKDSEQKWGVIAQGIDGNFEENKEATVNVIDMMKVEVMMEVMATMKKNVCFLCKCLE